MGPHHALTLLTRLIQRRPSQYGRLREALEKRLDQLAPTAIEVAVETGDPIGRTLVDCLTERPNPALAAELHPLIPDQTIALRELAAVVTAQFLDHVRMQGESGPTEATLLNNMAGRLLELGQPDRAVSFAKQAATLYRMMVDGGLDALRPRLAMCLNTLSVALAAAGQTDKALEPARESVALYRRCADASQSADTALLALSLNTLANRLMSQGHWLDALSAAEESVALYAELPEKARGPGALARALDTLSYTRLNSGRLDEAVEASRRAQALYRDLAEVQPDAFEPLLAVSCANIAGILLRMEDYSGALTAAEEAVGIVSQLVSVRAESFQDPFLRALLVYGLAQCALGRHTEAEETLAQALRILQSFDAIEPRHLSVPPQVHEGLALALAGQGRLAEACAKGERAVAEYANLPQQERDGHLPDLARCSRNLASIYLEAGEPAEARRALEEARGGYQVLRTSTPELFIPELTDVLRLTAEVSMLLGDPDRAFLALRNLLALLAPETLASPAADDVLANARRCFAEHARRDRAGVMDLLAIFRSCLDEAVKG